MQTERKHDTYVPALPEPRKIQIIEGEPAIPAPPEPVQLRTGYLDRAQGFTLATAPLAASAGLVSVLVGVVAFSVPWLSTVGLLLAFGGFALTWLISYIAHQLISPDGTLFMNSFWMWRYLRHEQRERHNRLRRMMDDDNR